MDGGGGFRAEGEVGDVKERKRKSEGEMSGEQGREMRKNHVCDEGDICALIRNGEGTKGGCQVDEEKGLRMVAGEDVEESYKGKRDRLGIVLYLQFLYFTQTLGEQAEDGVWIDIALKRRERRAIERRRERRSRGNWRRRQ